MAIDRRHFFGATAATGAFTATEAVAAPPARSSTVPVSSLGVEAMHLGVRFNGTDDQTEALQRAIDRTAGARLPLSSRPASIAHAGWCCRRARSSSACRGATRLVATDHAPLIVARDADHISLSGIIFDGSGKTLPEKAGLVHLANGRGVAIRDCEMLGAGRNGIVLEGVEGEVTGTTITGAPAPRSSRSMRAGCRSRATRSAARSTTAFRCGARRRGDDGTQVIDNRIEDIGAQNGGSGQNGNAINVFRAA